MNNTLIIKSFDDKIHSINAEVHNVSCNFNRDIILTYKVNQYDVSITILKNSVSRVRYMIHNGRNIIYCNWGNRKHLFKYLSYITGNGPETNSIIKLWRK